MADDWAVRSVDVLADLSVYFEAVGLVEKRAVSLESPTVELSA